MLTHQFSATSNSVSDSVELTQPTNYIYTEHTEPKNNGYNITAESCACNRATGSVDQCTE